MIQGLGTDIIEVDRIRKSIARHGSHFIDKIFSLSEQAYCNRYKDSVPNYAGRFAAKEAIVKALGTGIKQGISWLDIEVINDENGKPIVYLSPRVREVFGDPKILVSISHSQKYATATALWLER